MGLEVLAENEEREESSSTSSQGSDNINKQNGNDIDVELVDKASV